MNRKVRKSYKKPQVKQVKLVPEEATLANCKIYEATSTGTGSNRCLDASACRQPGS